ncbi:MAG: hypothetical protein RL344_1407 [Pseudomonadota bacterium]|jgi:hypoxanthine phosphoribosyltransferase
MQKNIDAHLYVSWNDYHDLIERLAIIVAQSGWQFDAILCLARGGLRVGDTLSRIFDVPLAILSTSSYREHSGTQQGYLNIAKHITVSSIELSGNILLLDDLADSGKTLIAVQQHLTVSYPKVLTVKTGVLWWKDCSQIKPDFYVQHLLNNPWIHQPFEQYDTMRPKDLM